MIKKNIKTMVLVFAMLMILVGCGKQNDMLVKESADKTDIEQSQNSVSDFPVTIKNYDESELTIQEKPNRIASLTLGTDEMLLDLVEDNRVVGLSGKNANNKAVSNVAEKAEKFPKVENNLEVLLQLKPDFVIGSSWVKKEFLQQLKDSNIPYYGYKTPTTIEEQKQIILDLSKVLGEDKKGKEIIHDIDARLKIVEEKVKNIKDEEKIRVMAYNMHGSTNAKGTIFDDIIHKAGAVNVSSEAGLEKISKISKEKIIELNPEVIILLAWAKDDLNEFNNFAEQLKQDESLQNVDAVKNNKVFIASNRYMTSVSQHIIEGVEFVAKSLYPEQF